MMRYAGAVTHPTCLWLDRGSVMVRYAGAVTHPTCLWLVYPVSDFSY